MGVDTSLDGRGGWTTFVSDENPEARAFRLKLANFSLKACTFGSCPIIIGPICVSSQNIIGQQTALLCLIFP